MCVLLVGTGAVIVVYALLEPSALAYRAIAPSTADLPGVGMLADVGVVALAALTLFVVWTLRREAVGRVAPAVVAMVAVPISYAVSEGLKLVVGESRPCRTEIVLADCPPIGDWSFPSNHSVIAFSLATAAIVASRSLVWTALPLAGLVAAGRVMQGVHYPHDVLAGAVVGTGITVVAVMIASPWVAQVISGRRRPADRSTGSRGRTGW